MSDVSQLEQLLSALVDGELTGEELSRAEQLLAAEPKYQKLVLQWRQQSDALRGLPKYRLDQNFPAKILSQIDRLSTGVPSPGPSHSSSGASLLSPWKTGLAAIFTLAAMLLLTLFVFPMNQRPESLAIHSPVTTANSAESLSAGKQELPSPGVAADSNSFELVENPQFDAGEALPLEIAGDTSAAPGIMSRSNRDYANQKSGDGIELDSDLKRGGEPAPLKVLSGTAAQGRVLESGEIANQPAPFSAADIDDREQVEMSVTANQNTVNQVFLVDVRSSDSPLSAVELALTRNRIEILANDGSDEMAPDQALLADDLNRAEDDVRSQSRQLLLNQSEVGIEALYVVAAPSQMQNAMEELSDQADISGFQVPQITNDVANDLASDLESAVELGDDTRSDSVLDAPKKSEMGASLALGVDPLPEAKTAEPQSAIAGSAMGGLGFDFNAPPADASMSELIEGIREKETLAAPNQKSGFANKVDQLTIDEGKASRKNKSDRSSIASAQQLRPGLNAKAGRYAIKPGEMLQRPADSELMKDNVRSQSLAGQAEPQSAEKNSTAGTQLAEREGLEKKSDDDPETQQQIVENQAKLEISKWFSKAEQPKNSKEKLVRYLLLIRTAPLREMAAPEDAAKQPD